MASFLAKLSWHDDNKVQMYQAAEEVIKNISQEVLGRCSPIRFSVSMFYCLALRTPRA